MDFAHTHINTIVEKKPYKVLGKDKKTYIKKDAYYYPGFTFTFKTIRDPVPKMVKCFFPCMILGLF